VILADTSAWVEFDRATGSSVHRRMSELVRSDGPLMVTEPVLMEVLVGARDDRRGDELRHLLGRFELEPFRTPGDFDLATTIYRRCRRVGVTPRGLLDCLVAAVAWRADAALLSYDTDLTRIADVIGVQVEPASR
jgi:predicted nucleic acid-binding protein